MKICEICGITSEQTKIIKNKDNRMLCRKHYLQIYKTGDIFISIYDRNEITYYENYAEIALRNKYGEVIAVTKIDLDDVDEVIKYKWHIKKSLHTSYAITTINEDTKLFLHRLILHYDGSFDIDHINHNGLDNRKSNLRIISHSQNLTNQYNEDNGIFQVNSGGFRATICMNGKSIYIGTYNTFEEAKENRLKYERSIF